MTKYRALLSSSLTFLALVGCAKDCWAQKPEGGEPNSVSIAQTSITTPINAIAQSPVQTESPQQTARDMLETIARVNNAATEVIGEVNRRQQMVVSNQYIHYDYTDNTSNRYSAPETEDVGPPLPPRKKWLDYGVEQLQRLGGMLNAELQSLQVPTNSGKATGEIRAQLDVARDNMDRINSQVTLLKSLSAGPVYDNAKINSIALQIQQELAGLNVVRKRLVRLY
jgi:hypothetical protein